MRDHMHHFLGDVPSQWNIYGILNICPLLLGGGGPTCRFIAIIWGGWTPPVYYVLKKWTPPVYYVLKKREPTQTWKFAKKHWIHYKRASAIFLIFFFGPFWGSIKGQGWTPQCTIIWHGDHYKRARWENWGKKNTIKGLGHEIGKKNTIKRQGHEVGNFTIFGNTKKYHHYKTANSKKQKNTIKGQGWTQPEKVYKMIFFFFAL